MPEHHPSRELEYNYITDDIYIGTNQCCQSHFDERLKQEGITADISLEEDQLDHPLGVEFYLWLPVKNQTAPTPEQLDLGVTVLEKLTALKKKIYVHCKNGHGRAPTLVAAYLVRNKKMTPEAAEELIKAKRPAVHLEESQRQALKNLWTTH